MERRLLLDVVVGQGAAVLELLASKDQALLVRWDALLVLDLGLDIVDGVRRLYLLKCAKEDNAGRIVCDGHRAMRQDTHNGQHKHSSAGLIGK